MKILNHIEFILIDLLVKIANLQITDEAYNTDDNYLLSLTNKQYNFKKRKYDVTFAIHKYDE